jgi:hypothetical protein
MTNQTDRLNTVLAGRSRIERVSSSQRSRPIIFHL